MNLQVPIKHESKKILNLSFPQFNIADQSMAGVTQLYYTFENKNMQVNKKSLSNGLNKFEINVDMHNILHFIDDDIGMNINSYISIVCLTTSGKHTAKTVHLKGSYDYSNGADTRFIKLYNDTEEQYKNIQNVKLTSTNNRCIKRINGHVLVLTEQQSFKKGNHANKTYKGIKHQLNSEKNHSGYHSAFCNGNKAGLVSVEQTYYNDCALQTVDFSDFLGNKNLTGAAVFVKSFDVSLKAGYQIKWIRVGTDAIQYEGSKISFTPQVQAHDSCKNIESVNINLLVVGTYDIED